MSEISRKQIEDIEYWRSLNPQSSITENPFPAGATPYEVSDDMDIHLDQLKREGYFQTSPIVPETDRTRLISIIETMVGKDLLSTYALLYDDFYHVAAKLAGVLTPILGNGFQLVPDEFEAYFIDTDDGESGSGPHRDSLRSAKAFAADGMPTLVNIWVALTDATPLNSCMYVLPGHLDPDYPRPREQRGGEQNLHEIQLQDVRSLPVKAGSVICWSSSLLHWGGRSSRFAAGPRMSFAMYFQRGDVPHIHPTSMDIPGSIPFNYRLYLVEKVSRDIFARSVYEKQRQSRAELSW